jgi:hypothetical protein
VLRDLRHLTQRSGERFERRRQACSSGHDIGARQRLLYMPVSSSRTGAEKQEIHDYARPIEMDSK